MEVADIFVLIGTTTQSIRRGFHVASLAALAGLASNDARPRYSDPIWNSALIKRDAYF